VPTQTLTIDLRMLYASGIGTYIRNLVPRIMHALPGTHFTLLGRPEELDQLDWTRRKNTNIVECRSRIYSLGEQLELVQRIPRDTDLFWSPHYPIPIFFRGKLLVTVHDVFHLAWPGRLHRRLYAELMFWAVRNKASAILADSHFSRLELSRLTGKGRQEINTVHLGVDASWFDVGKKTRPYLAPYLLFVGNVKPHKNLTGLIRAFGLIAQAVHQDLVIVGKREGFISGDTEVAREARRLGERIQFTGHVADDELFQYVAHADALVLPSLYEGFGLPPLEAMACSCPVIVSNAASLPEVCGDAALYCDPNDPSDIADKIQQLMRDPKLRDELRAKGLEQARKFSWDKCARETLDVIKHVLSA
jgi:glycosyltransferase involved in cell wall biosynthesis